MRKRLIVLLLLFLIPISLSLQTESAVARSNGWMSWVVDLDFANDQINAILTLTVNFNDPRTPPIEESIPLACTTYGSLEIINEEAIFSGDDYITCDMPDLVEKVYELTEGRLNISSQCACEENPWIEAQFALGTENKQSEPINPVFHHPNLQLYAPLVSNEDAQLTFTVDGKTAQSEPFSFIEGQQMPIWAQFIESPFNDYVPEFIVDGINLTATPTAVSAPLILSNQAATLYIGYASGAYFEGTLKTLRADPACRGYG